MLAQAPSSRSNWRILSGWPTTPVLLLTQGGFGYDPSEKLHRSAELARMLGADTVVVHPPFRWQLGYSRIFADNVKDVAERHNVAVAVVGVASPLAA